jgi:hypothetical protein
MGETGYSYIISVRKSEKVILIPLGELGHKWENSIKTDV